jgi:hypothetical protein
MGDEQFRVTRIDLDENQDVSDVYAVADDDTVAVLQEIAGRRLPQYGPAGSYTLIMPVQDMLQVWRVMDHLPGTDPRYRYLVSSSLARVYFGLISEEGE